MSIFDKIMVRKPKYSTFDLSHEKKLSMKMGKLVPTMLQEVLPGDRFKVDSTIMMRLAPMLAPIMHRVNVYTHYFFVPNRIIWDGFEDFVTGGDDGLTAPNVQPEIIIRKNGYFEKGSLSDYFGVPVIESAVTPSGGFGISQLPFRAYQTIYNEYYRDENLSSEIVVPKDSATVDTGNPAYDALLALRNRAWEKDYLTSCLPWAQKSQTEVDMPLNINYKQPAEGKQADGSPAVSGNANFLGSGLLGDNSSNQIRLENIDNASFTINEFRKANRLQQWLERNARGGSRYIEHLFAHFGVKSSDARLQRPEYLGGGKQKITLSEVLNTNGIVADGAGGVTGGNVQGEMAGHGISVGNTNKFSRRFEEHGFVVGITSVIPRTAYQQSLHKLWRRTSRFDYYYPEFANLGEQEVKNSEAFLNYADLSQAGNTFGYQSRFAEYKYGCDTVHGDFRDNLKFWHMGRIFGSAPALNSSFVESDPDTNRIFAVKDVDHLYVNIYHNVKAVRPMPYYGSPML